MVQKYDLYCSWDGGGSPEQEESAEGLWVFAEDYDSLAAKLKNMEEEFARWQPIIDEVDRRANKTGAFDNREDFTVTVNIDDYLKAYFGDKQ
jgi:hypothetical protein